MGSSCAGKNDQVMVTRSIYHQKCICEEQLSHIYPDRIAISKFNQFFCKNLYDSCKKKSYPAV